MMKPQAAAGGVPCPGGAMSDEKKDTSARTFCELAGEQYDKQEAEIEAWLDSLSPEELAKAGERYPTGLGSWTRNPYLD